VSRVYSKTSNNGPSEKRTTSLQRADHLLNHQIEAEYKPEYIIIIHLKDFKCYFCL